MKTIIAGIVVVLVLASGLPALAQSQGLGGVLNDALGSFLSDRPGAEQKSWRGHFVQAKGTTMVFRAEDGKTYAVDMSAVNTQAWQSLTLGQPVTLAATPGSGTQTLIASRIEAEQQDRSGRLREERSFRAAHGVVERVEGSKLMVRTAENGLVTVDVSQMTGEAEFRARDGALLILEPGQANTVVWIEREDRQREDRRGGGGRDILSGLSGEYRKLHGYRVSGSNSTMVVLADDGTTSTVDMSAIPSDAPIELGKAVTLAVKPGREPNTFVAGRISPDSADASAGKIAKRPFESAQGTVESIRGSTIRFKTSDGQVLRADASRMPGRSAVQANNRGTLTYERKANGQITALWLERQEIQPSASGSVVLASSGEYQRIHGYVQSVEWATMSLKADDGRTLKVDTSQIDSQMRTQMRPGDLVSVLGKTTPGANQFMAERVERR